MYGGGRGLGGLLYGWTLTPPPIGQPIPPSLLEILIKLHLLHSSITNTGRSGEEGEKGWRPEEDADSISPAYVEVKAGVLGQESAKTPENVPFVLLTYLAYFPWFIY